MYSETKYSKNLFTPKNFGVHFLLQSYKYGSKIKWYDKIIKN